MEGSVLSLTPASPTKPPVTPKPSASDENEHYYQQLGSPNLSNPKKSMKKHYMSPTISATCKAVSSRKNILGERNDASESVMSRTHVEKATPLTSPVSKSLSVENFVVSDDLSSRPYDPVTNYTSPRPQFLRYNPNRRRELILGLGNSNADGNDGLSDWSVSRSGSFDSQKANDEEDGSVGTSDKQEDDEGVEKTDEKSEGIDGGVKGADEETKGVEEVIEGSNGEIEDRGEEIEESDEEDEEVEEENKGCSLKGVLKSLFVFVVLVLFMSHMASMNQETLYDGAEEAYLRSENHTFETDLKKLEGGSNYWDHREGQLSLVEGVNGANDIGIKEGNGVQLVEHELGSEVLGQEQQVQMGFVEEHWRVDEEVEEETKVEGDENLGTAEHAVESRELIASQAEENETVELTQGEEKMGVDALSEVVVLQVGDSEEVSDQIVENSEFQDDESFHHNQTPAMFDQVEDHNLNSDASYALEVVEGELAVEPIDIMVKSEMDRLDYSSKMMDEFLMSDSTDEGKTGRGGEILDSGAEYKWVEELLDYMKMMKSKTFHTAIVMVSSLSVAAASVAFWFHFRQKKAINKDSLVIANTAFMKNLIIEQKKMIEKESTTSEKYNSALATMEGDSIEQGVYSSFRRMSLSSNSKLSSSKGSEGYHSKAPRIELLGEFVVGDISSPLRSCGLKNQMKEGEQSNYELRTQAQSVSIQQQPSVSEFSFTGSFSHKSYTSEKKIKPTEPEISSMDTSHGSYTSEKIVKIKEGGKNGEVKVIATPVRRSSRIRSKTVMSP